MLLRVQKINSDSLYDFPACIFVVLISRNNFESYYYLTRLLLVFIFNDPSIDIQKLKKNASASNKGIHIFNAVRIKNHPVRFNNYNFRAASMMKSVTLLG